MNYAAGLEWTFWLSAAAVIYAYVGYPLALMLIQKVRRPTGAYVPGTQGKALPSVTIIIPVHNERSTIEGKLLNTRVLTYPAGLLEVLFVSDGSTDGSNEIIAAQADDRSRLIVLETRGGKASALNAGLAAAKGDILVFSDASIALAPESLLAIVKPFEDARVGCVSGEDRIEGGGGEGLYGRYELYLRRQESMLHSIVGASGSFYAQRRHLCSPFTAGLAPDFLSVLRTVEQGYRAIAEPRAAGTMEALQDPRDEFGRKVRTILRGITTLREYAHLVNPFRYGWFGFELLSHKVARWLVPFFLVTLLASAAALSARSPSYAAAFLAQAAFYALAAAALLVRGALGASSAGRVTVYFTTVNVATLSAWLKFAMGARQEIWSPTRR